MQFLAHIPFVEHLGFELLQRGAGRSQVAVNLSPELSNHYNVAHGGLLMTLLDVAMAQAARSPMAPDGAPYPSVVTIEMKTSFMSPGVGRLVAHGKLLTRTATMAFAEGRILNADGELVSHATATFKYMRALPTGADGRQIQTPDGAHTPHQPT